MKLKPYQYMNQNFFICKVLGVIAIFLFNSCTNNDTNNLKVIDNKGINQTYTLVPEDTINISIDNKTKPFHFTTNICYNNSKELLYFTESNRIDLYDIDTKNLEKQIQIPFGGPDGVGSLEYVRYVSHDTIYVKGKSPFKIYHFNSEGKKVRTFDLTKNSYIAKRGFWANANSVMSYSNDRLLLYVNPTATPAQWFFNEPLIFTYNCKDSTTSVLPFRFPQIFNNNQKTWIFVDFEPALVQNKDNIVLSYPFLDSLYVYNKKQKNLKRYSIKSIFQEKQNNGQPKSKDPSIYYKSYQDITAYYFLMYDQFRDVYYRFVLHPVEVNTKGKLVSLGSILEQKPLSIQIINSKYQLVGEINLMTKRYGIDDFFIGEKGLYLSNNNVLNKNFNENELSYTIFALHKLAN